MNKEPNKHNPFADLKQYKNQDLVAQTLRGYIAEANFALCDAMLADRAYSELVNDPCFDDCDPGTSRRMAPYEAECMRTNILLASCIDRITKLWDVYYAGDHNNMSRMTDHWKFWRAACAQIHYSHETGKKIRRSYDGY